ncbi:centrosomal protein 43-like [Armigeres subalbatus]|uniref:centrosomal protein 43-like n=1 Tax=Armigeres subalbatus TaxID=124917 RepID=UPI002ED303BA
MDEDVEFRDMVLKKLEEKGSLLEIKAKLRAYLYDVIENDGKVPEVINDTDLTYNNSVDKSELEDGEESAEPEQVDDRSLALGLVFDLLDCLKLPYTKKVLSAETGVQKPCTRVRLKREFLRKSFDGVSGLEDEAILLQLIEQNRKESTSGESTGDVSQVSKEATESHMTAPEEEVTDNSVATTI